MSNEKKDESVEPVYTGEAGLPHRIWVRSDDDFRSRIGQIAAAIDRPIAIIARDGAEREMAELLKSHPKLQGFEFEDHMEWLTKHAKRVKNRMAKQEANAGA